MNISNFHSLLDTFQTIKIAVLGDAMLDSYLHGLSERLCREAPVPVVNVTDYEYVPGGAANTAVNLSSLGAEVVFLSTIGSDREGEILLERLEASGVNTENVLISPRRKTLAKQRILAGSQMVVRYDHGSTDRIDREDEERLIEKMRKLYGQCNAWVISDYSYGNLTPGVIQALTLMQDSEHCLIVVDSKHLTAFRSIHMTAVKPNYPEAVELLGLEKIQGINERVIQIAAHGSEILDLTGAQISAVTIDEAGSLIFERDRLPYRTYAQPTEHTMAAGAGDTFVAAFSLALASNASTEEAAEIAQAASTIVVGKSGTSACYIDELHSIFSSDQKILTDAFQIAGRIAAYKRENKRVVFTNGCFDILHRGHVTYLNRAKNLGDILIVGLNSDESVQRLKGPDRPINRLDDRANVLAALSSVDHIVPFSEDTPHELIKLIHPDVYVKGGDYTIQTLPETELVRELGGAIHVLPYVEEQSTSGIIERIINSVRSNHTPVTGD